MPIRNVLGVADTTERDALAVSADPNAPPLAWNRTSKTLQVYSKALGVWLDVSPNYIANQTHLTTLRTSITTTVLNGGSQTLIAAAAGYAYQLIDFTMTAVGGNAATATSVRINGTQAASGVNLVTVAVAALTRSTAVRPNSANVTLLADGAWSATCDADTAITCDVNNNNLATATSIIFELRYLVIPS